MSAIVVVKVLKIRCLSSFTPGGLSPLCLVLILGAAPGSLTAGEPAVRKPVSPQVAETDLSQLSDEHAVKPWQPGDPVRVVEDLRESAEENVANKRSGTKEHQPVAPDVTEGVTGDAQKVEEWKPGDPIRVIEDLKEDEESDP